MFAAVARARRGDARRRRVAAGAVLPVAAGAALRGIVVGSLVVFVFARQEDGRSGSPGRRRGEAARQQRHVIDAALGAARSLAVGEPVHESGTGVPADPDRRIALLTGLDAVFCSGRSAGVQIDAAGVGQTKTGSRHSRVIDPPGVRPVRVGGIEELHVLRVGDVELRDLVGVSHGTVARGEVGRRPLVHHERVGRVAGVAHRRPVEGHLGRERAGRGHRHQHRGPQASEHVSTSCDHRWSLLHTRTPARPASRHSSSLTSTPTLASASTSLASWAPTNAAATLPSRSMR
jgi:hypothetical protein